MEDKTQLRKKPSKSATKTNPSTNSITKPIIKPVVINNGEPHDLEELVANRTAPIMTAIGCVNLDSKSNRWISYTIKARGTEIISIEVGEPNMRAIAVDEAKISFVTNFMGGE